jgi:hypothetical protein
VWLAGLLGPFMLRSLAPLRFVPIAYAVAAVVIAGDHGKDYYLAAAYPSLIALGGVALAQAVRSAPALISYGALAVGFTAFVTPLALPVLSPAGTLSYLRAIHLTPQRQEKGEVGTPLPQSLADQLGWHDFVREVADAFDKIPVDERARTSILVDNYGEAAAIEIYGPAYGLPPPLSGHNQYGLWGMRGQDPRNVLRVFRPTRDPSAYCDNPRVLGTTGSQYGMAFEDGKSILYCPNAHPPLRSVFGDFLHID